MTPAELEKAKVYSKKKYTVALLHLGLELLLLAFLVISPLAILFREWSQNVSGNFYLQLTVDYALFFVYLWVFDVCFSYFSGFRLEHAFGLSNQTLPAWLWEFLKKTLLSFGITLPLVMGFYFLVRRFPDTWWFWAWLGFAGFAYLMGQLFPVLIVPLFYKYSRVEDEGLRKRVFDLVARYRLPLENVYSLNLSKTTKKANAMFAGLGRTKRLVLGDTLIQNFAHDEIESVVAHELGHFKNKDIWLHFGFNVATSFVGFLLAFRLLKKIVPQMEYTGMDDLALFPLLYLLSSLLGLTLVPLSNAFSRWREKEADRFALKAAGKSGFIGAMEKLAQINLADPNPHPLIVLWFYSHPPIAKRIAMAKAGIACFLAFLILSWPAPGFSAEEQSAREAAAKALEARAKAEFMNFYLGNPKAEQPKAALAIDLYNQAVGFFEQREYDLARQALNDSLSYDPKNPFAHELLGDIAYYEQKLDEALTHYEAALRLSARKDLQEKILKVKTEKPVESKLATYGAERFIIKYKGEDRGLEGFELREILRNSYREVGQELGYFFKQKVVVLLYDEAEYRSLSGPPHWSSGAYDGKIRLPAYQVGHTSREIEKIMKHELTHAFIHEISRGRAPAWINEGLAVYEESKIEPPDPIVFESAVRTNTLFALPVLFDEKSLLTKKDALEVKLFYDESYQLVKYLVERYKMFAVKKMLEAFGQGKDTFDAVGEVLKISPAELEREWKETFPQS